LVVVGAGTLIMIGCCGVGCCVIGSGGGIVGIGNGVGDGSLVGGMDIVGGVGDVVTSGLGRRSFN